jgi:hypothetical protein
MFAAATGLRIARGRQPHIAVIRCEAQNLVRSALQFFYKPLTRH